MPVLFLSFQNEQIIFGYRISIGLNYCRVYPHLMRCYPQTLRQCHTKQGSFWLLAAVFKQDSVKLLLCFAFPLTLAIRVEEIVRCGRPWHLALRRVWSFIILGVGWGFSLLEGWRFFSGIRNGMLLWTILNADCPSSADIQLNPIKTMSKYHYPIAMEPQKIQNFIHPFGLFR